MSDISTKRRVTDVKEELIVATLDAGLQLDKMKAWHATQTAYTAVIAQKHFCECFVDPLATDSLRSSCFPN